MGRIGSDDHRGWNFAEKKFLQSERLEGGYRHLDMNAKVVPKTRFSEGHKRPSIGDIARRLNQTAIRKNRERTMQSRLLGKIERLRRSPQLSGNESSVFGGTKILLRIPANAIDSREEKNVLAGALEIRRHSLRYILNNSNDPQHRSRINPLPLGLVVQRNIPTRNRRPQRITSLGNPIDRRRKLRHNLRLLRIPKVQ